MDRLGAACLCRRDDRVAAQIGFTGRRGAEPHAIIGEGDMRRGGVGVRIDRDAAHPERARAAHDPQRNLAAIGDQQRRDGNHA